VVVVVKAVAVFQCFETGFLYEVQGILPVLCKLQGIVVQLLLQFYQIISEII
jgi:hypothetical protein